MKAEKRRITVSRTDDINNTGNVISEETIGECEIPDSDLDVAIELWCGKSMDEIIRDIMKIGVKTGKEQE